MPNRLAGATSPYLLQHAENPVDWWEWGPEAFEEARRRDVPVLRVPAEAPQQVDRLRGPALLNLVGQVKTVHHGHRRSLRASQLRRITRWPPSCQSWNHSRAIQRCPG